MRRPEPDRTPSEEIAHGSKALALAALPLLTSVGRRVALEAAGSPSNGEAEAARRGATLRADVARAIRAGDAQASEAAMRALVELDWTILLEGYS